MKPSSAKQKGRSLQAWIRDRLLETFPSLKPDDVRNTSSGAQGEDVQLSPAARELIPFQIECKNLARIAVYKFYEQAKTHGEHEPLVFIKQNRSDPLVILDARVFFKLLYDSARNHP